METQIYFFVPQVLELMVLEGVDGENWSVVGS